MSPQPPPADLSEDGYIEPTPLGQTMIPNGFGTIWCDQSARSYEADGHACDILGIPPQGLMSAGWLVELLAQITPEPSGPQRYHTFRNHRGTIVRARLLWSPRQHLVILVDDLEDITNRVFRLKAGEREYRELFENAFYGIYRATNDGRFSRVNPALVTLAGYASEAEMLHALNADPGLLYVDPDRLGQFFAELNAKGKVVDFVSEIRRNGTGEHIWISETAWTVRDDSGRPRYMAGTVIEVTERMRILERMRAAAETDVLTGLANRALFYSELERRTAMPGTAALTVLLVDCDRFKEINDVYGHARGDAVLRICADRLRAVVPAEALLARLGGDEFAILCWALPDAAAALDLASRVTKTLEAPIEVDDAKHLLSASIGISRYPEHAVTALDLLRNADLALYSVKDKGRAHARLFDAELDRVKQSRHALELDLRDADFRGELELFYQPVVDARSATIVGLEALVRWRHPQRGLVPPQEFIPVAEDAGLMLAFGTWAIREACRHAAALPSHINVAVNVSALQFRSSDLPGVVAKALADFRLNPQRLELEVTESVVLRNETATFHTLERLRAIGVKIALDDFGTGYSCLSYLQHFAFDKVKIDRSFIGSIKTNAVNLALTRAVLSIGRDLGLAVVAEGIETDAERQALLSEGCILMQGFHYGRPVPFTDMASRIAAEMLRPAQQPMPPAIRPARTAS